MIDLDYSDAGSDWVKRKPLIGRSSTTQYAWDRARTSALGEEWAGATIERVSEARTVSYSSGSRRIGVRHEEREHSQNSCIGPLDPKARHTSRIRSLTSR